jgi:multisubunit Na+/H+ antiporter MnhB subunit
MGVGVTDGVCVGASIININVIPKHIPIETVKIPPTMTFVAVGWIVNFLVFIFPPNQYKPITNE